MDFQRKTVPFLHRGMNWNSPVEKLQDGQVAWAKNLRVLEQGTVSSAHGMTLLFTGVPANYLHSMSRLNILNEESNADGTSAFDSRLQRTYVLGADQLLFVFQDQQTLAFPLNPVVTPLRVASSGQEPEFSGNPLSVIDAQPLGAAVAWKYIGDSQQMVTVGYYPGDTYDVTPARALTIGMDPPVNTVHPIVNSADSITPTSTAQLAGNYQWAFAYRRVQTGARSNPSAATRVNLLTPSTTAGSDSSGNAFYFSATLQLPPTPIDPQTSGNDTHIVVDVYRFGGVIFRWALVGSGAGDTFFTDNVPDESLLAAPSPSQATDASTGLTRFNLYRPFVTQDIARAGNGTIKGNQTGSGGNLEDPQGRYYLETNDNNLFNLEWLPGSTIYVNSTACTIYQVIDQHHIELMDDITGQLANGEISFGIGAVNWSTNAGTLAAGQPLPHLWGPYGIGQSGSYIFACGDPNARGTMYWTNGNDPDSTDIVNNIIVTSPSEKLVTGCVYDGQPFCWSTERQFQIFPSLTIFGQFTTQEVAGAKGVWLEWSLSVQSNGLSDQSVSWRGKDGIYDWSSQGLQRLTDPLYAFFPHDNNPGLAPETIMPFINADSHHPERVGNLDDTQPKYHRLCWFQGLLYYDFVCQDNPAGLPLEKTINTYSTLVWDSVNIPNGGWVSLDQPFSVSGNPTNLYPVARGIDIGANDPAVDATIEPGPIYGPMARGGSMKVLFSGPATVGGSITSGGTIYDYYGYTRGFESRFITRAEDLGDPRAQKRWGDYWLDCTPLDTFTVYPLSGFHRCAMQPVTVPGDETSMTPDFCGVPTQPGNRAQFIMDFLEFKGKDGASLMSPTLGLDVIWTGADGQFSATLNEWQPSFVPKPEVISFRATDPDDMGVLGAKYFTGMNLEANTWGAAMDLDVILDGQVIDTESIDHSGQSEKPYAFTPKAGYLMQLQQHDDGITPPPTWQFYKANWIYEPWPDATTRASFFSDLGYTGSKFLQGMVVPMETGGNPASFQVSGDCNQSATMGPVSTPNLCKMDVAFSFGPCNNSPSDPFIASQVQIQPNSDMRIWYDQIRWIWEPEPELVATWDTQPTDHDLPGWHSLRDCYIAYRGGNGAPTLYVTTEYGVESYLLDFVGPNFYTRCYRVLRPQKAKWRSYRVEGCGLFRLYFKDCEVRAKAWGSTGAYQSFQPFGELSRANGGARI